MLPPTREWQFCFSTLTLSGPGFVAYTQTPNGTSAAANFSTLPVAYTWSGGTGIAPGTTFDITLASWVSNETPTSTPEPSASDQRAHSNRNLRFHPARKLSVGPGT